MKQMRRNCVIVETKLLPVLCLSKATADLYCPVQLRNSANYDKGVYSGRKTTLALSWDSHSRFAIGFALCQAPAAQKQNLLMLQKAKSCRAVNGK